MPRTTEENEALAVSIVTMLEDKGYLPSAIDRDEVITETWTKLDNADGRP